MLIAGFAEAECAVSGAVAVVFSFDVPLPIESAVVAVASRFPFPPSFCFDQPPPGCARCEPGGAVISWMRMELSGCGFRFRSKKLQIVGVLTVTSRCVVAGVTVFVAAALLLL